MIILSIEKTLEFIPFYIIFNYVKNKDFLTEINNGFPGILFVYIVILFF